MRGYCASTPAPTIHGIAMTSRKSGTSWKVSFALLDAYAVRARCCTTAIRTHEDELSTETGGLMVIVQYPGPTTGGRPIYEDRFNMRERQELKAERTDL